MKDRAKEQPKEPKPEMTHDEFFGLGKPDKYFKPLTERPIVRGLYRETAEDRARTQAMLDDPL